MRLWVARGTTLWIPWGHLFVSRLPCSHCPDSSGGDNHTRMASARRRETVRLTAPLAVLSLVSTAGTALAPGLVLEQPLLLVALCPRAVFVLAAATQVALGPLMLVATVRLILADPLHFRLGRLHGAGPVGRMGRWIPIERIGAPLVALSPTGKVLALAGAAGTPAGRVALADLAGTLLRLVALCGLGRAVTPSAGQVLAALGPVAIAIPVLVLVGVAGRAGLQELRRMGQPWTTREATCVSW